MFLAAELVTRPPTTASSTEADWLTPVASTSSAWRIGNSSGGVPGGPGTGHRTDAATVTVSTTRPAYVPGEMVVVVPAVVTCFWPVSTRLTVSVT